VQKKLLAVRYNTINDTNNSSLLVGGMMNKKKRGRKAIIDGRGTIMRESLSTMHRHQQEKIIDQGQIKVDDDNDEEKKRIMSQAEIVCQRRLAVFRWTMTITVSLGLKPGRVYPPLQAQQQARVYLPLKVPLQAINLPLSK
jgi:hypothetical protein